MASILLMTFTNLPDCGLDSFRQGFVDALLRQGNDVYLFLSNNFIPQYNDNNFLSRSIDSAALIRELQSMGLDAVVSINHSGLFAGLVDALRVPVGIWLLDGPDYLIDPEACKERASIYQMCVASRVFWKQLKFELGYPDENIHLIPLCTDFKAADIAQDDNISFVGTMFPPHEFPTLVRTATEKEQLRSSLLALIDSFHLEPDSIISDRLRRYGLQREFAGQFATASLLNTLSLNHRIKVLDAVSDLGLKLYGSLEWPSVAPYSIRLGLCYRKRLLYTRSELEDLYNGSKINLNICHVQAYDGLPWRVYDIMASRGILVSDNATGLQSAFGDLGLPTYDTPQQARTLCESLLGDDQAREQIREISNRAINRSHRFDNRLEIFEEVFGLKLRNQPRPGKFVVLDPQRYILPDKSNIKDDPGTRPAWIVPRTLPLQVFYSSSPVFTEEDSIRASINTKGLDTLTWVAPLPAAPKYLRLDIGDFFSKHKHMTVTIEEEESGNSVELDLRTGIISKHEFLHDSSTVVCGNDACIVFLNPWPGRTICIHFNSRLVASI